jgi:hypothetical protein
MGKKCGRKEEQSKLAKEILIQAFLLELLIGISDGTTITLGEAFRSFPQFLQANAEN